MSLAAILAMPPRGRPRSADLPAERARHVEAAGLFYGTMWPVSKIARTLGVSTVTVYLWVHRALAYDSAEADAVRRLARTSERRLRPSA